MTDVSESYLESLRNRADFAETARAIEQRGHGITKQQLTVLQTQYEDMQTELKDAQLRTALDAAFMDANDECIKELNDELDTERRLNNAALKPQQTVHAEDTGDLKRARARTRDVKAKLSETLAHAANLADANGELTLHNKNHLTTIRHLRGEIEELNDSAETQALHMQDVDTACKAAEEKCIEQRKEIETLECGEGDVECSNADACKFASGCIHVEPHTHTKMCDTLCGVADARCVPVNPCTECATLREEIINRDAVILEQERKADRTGRIMHEAMKQLNKLRECVEMRKRGGIGQRIMQSTEFDTPELHQGSHPHAYCVRPFMTKIHCEREDMPTGKRHEMLRHRCEFFDACPVSQSNAFTCTAGQGHNCGKRRELEAKQ